MIELSQYVDKGLLNVFGIRKIRKYKNIKEFITSLKSFIVNINNHSIDKLIKKTKMLKGVKVVYNANGYVIMSIGNFNASKILGSKSWCIVTDLDMWKQYVSDEVGNQQYFIWDFNREISDVYSQIGVAMQAPNKAYACHLKNDDELDFESYIESVDIPRDIFKPLSYEKIKKSDLDSDERTKLQIKYHKSISKAEFAKIDIEDYIKFATNNENLDFLKLTKQKFGLNPLDMFGSEIEVGLYDVRPEFYEEVNKLFNLERKLYPELQYKYGFLIEMRDNCVSYRLLTYLIKKWKLYNNNDLRENLDNYITGLGEYTWNPYITQVYSSDFKIRNFQPLEDISVDAYTTMLKYIYGNDLVEKNSNYISGLLDILTDLVQCDVSVNDNNEIFKYVSSLINNSNAKTENVLNCLAKSRYL